MDINFEEIFRQRMIREAAVDPVIRRMVHYSMGCLASADPSDDGVDVTLEFATRSARQLTRFALIDREDADAVFVTVLGDMAKGSIYDQA